MGAKPVCPDNGQVDDCGSETPAVSRLRNLDRDLSREFVLPRPKMAGRRRFREQTLKLEPASKTSACGALSIRHG